MFDMLEDILPKCTEAHLPKDVLKKVLTFRDALKLLHQLLDLVHADKILADIPDLTIPCVVGLLHRWVVEKHILSMWGLESHSLPIHLLQKPGVAVLGHCQLKS